MKRRVISISFSLLASAVIIPIILLLISTNSSTTYAKTDHVRQSLTSDYTIQLVCPDVVDLKWNPEKVFEDPQDGCTFVEWELLRGLSDDREQMEVIYTSRDRSEDYHRDQNPVRDKASFYTHHVWFSCPPDDKATKVALNILETYVGDYCNGVLYDQYQFTAGETYIRSLYVEDGGSLQIPVNTYIKKSEGSSGQITCREGGEIQIDFADVVDLSISYLAGSSGWVRDSIFHTSNLRFSDAQGIPVIGNTFIGGFDPNLAGNKIDLWYNSSSNIEQNKGEFGIYLHDQSQAAIKNNNFAGSVGAAKESQATLEGNTLRGTVSASAYGAAVGNEATLKLYGNTISAQDLYGDVLIVSSGARVIAGGNRLENTFCTAPSACTIISAEGGDLSITGGTILGSLSAGDDLDITGLKSFIGRLTLDDQANANIEANTIESHMFIGGDAHITIQNNVFTKGTIHIGDQTTGEIKQNAIWDSNTYAFDIEGGASHPDLTITNNCIESPYGMIIRRLRTTEVGVENNWWGDSKGPYIFNINTDTQGAVIANENVDTSPNVDFYPYLEAAQHCYQKPPELPTDVSATISAQGGTLYAPDGSTKLSFPAGAVDQDTTVTYSSPGSSSSQDLAIPGYTYDSSRQNNLTADGEIVTIRLFDLSAAISGTTTPVLSFNLPYTLTLDYTFDDLRGADEDTLNLFWRDDDTWKQLSTASHDTQRDLLTFTLDHMTAFALKGEVVERFLYLPLAMR